MSRPIKKTPEGLYVMRVIDHFFFLHCPLLPLLHLALSAVTDCTHSWDERPYGTQVYWLLDYTVDGVLLLHSKGPVGGIVFYAASQITPVLQRAG